MFDISQIRIDEQAFTLAGDQQTKWFRCKTGHKSIHYQWTHCCFSKSRFFPGINKPIPFDG